MLDGALHLGPQADGYWYGVSWERISPAYKLETVTDPDFEGLAVKATINGPPPQKANQHAYLYIETGVKPGPMGPWAIETSYKIVRAPKKLVHTGWMLDPLYMIASVGMPQSDNPWRVVGGVRLVTHGGKYYPQLYRVNEDGSNTPYYNFNIREWEIGRKERLRIELFERGGKKFIKAMEVEPQSGGAVKYYLIGEAQLSSDV